MIEKALYNTIQPVINSFPLNGDVQETKDGKPKAVKLPLAVYAESYMPVHTKDGISHYAGTFFVSVIAKTKLEVLNLSNQIITALTNIEGSTVDNTDFMYVRQANELAVDYDPDDKAFFSEISIAFKSKKL